MPKRRILAIAGAAGLSSTALLVLPQAAPAAGTSDICTVPTLSDVLVSQGPAQATALVPGKTMLVKLYLSTPACLPAGASVQITGGTLTVGNNAAGPVPLAATTALPPIAPSSTSPMVSSPSDALFLVPGSLVAPNAGSKITFGATLKYSVRLNGSPAPGGEVTFSYVPGAVPSLSAPMSPSLSNLDVLVVPLGTANGGALATQYSEKTRQATAVGFGTARRLLPTTDNGLNYATGAGVILPGTTSPLCANGYTFAHIVAPAIEAQRTAWNSISDNTHMDRALGVIDPAVSSGPSTTAGGNSNCADGFGSLSGPLTATQGAALADAGPGTDAFARAVTTTSTYGGPTVGSLFTMELAHTTGAVSDTYAPNLTSGPNGATRASGAHSRWVTGDPQGTGRAFNIDTQQPIVDSRSAMNFSNVGWWDAKTVLEKEDWDYLVCSLLPGAPPVGLAPELSGCSYPGGFSAAAASSNGSYAVSGTMTTSGETVAETVESQSTVIDPPVPNSPIRVVQTDADGKVLANDGIGAHLNSTVHDDDGDPVYTSDTATFGALVAARPGTKHLAIYLGAPSPTNPPRYQRDVPSRPSVTSVSVGPGTISISVGHPLPGNLRFDLFGTCGTETAPLVLDQHPTSTTPPVAGAPGTAVLVTTYDGSLLCSAPKLSGRVHDGIQSQTVQLDNGTGGVVSPTAEITAPTPNAVATSQSNLGLAGKVVDAAGHAAASVKWTAVSGTSTTELATTSTATAVPPAGGWPAGITTITLSGYDTNGNLLATSSRVVTIELDSDGDGLTDEYENSQACFGPNAASNPNTANLDSDGDGYANIDDLEPCVSANTVTVVFDPHSLYKSATGQSTTAVTAYLSNPRGIDLTKLKASDLVVQQIDGITVARLTGSAKGLPATAYTVTSPTTATVKFDRYSLVKLLGNRLGITPIFIGTVDTRLRGADPASPYVFP